MSNVLYRPGVLLGRYPQKKQAEQGFFRQRAAVLSANIIGLIQWQRYQPNYIVDQVNQNQMDYRHLSEQVLTEKLAELRRNLYRYGLQDELIVLSFTLIRELMDRTLGKRLYDEQMFCGWIMINGLLAQMATGEGKTLAAALTAGTAALAGIPVHVITANDYLAARDADTLKPLYNRLGLTSGAVIENMSIEQRHAVYEGDIVHVSNKQIAFDYLRDKITQADDSRGLRLQYQQIQTEQFGGAKLWLRGLCFAIIDEADSVLIDEAKTPLIISKTIENQAEEEAFVGALYIASTLQVKRDFHLKADKYSAVLTTSGMQRVQERSKSFPGAWQTKLRREELVTKALVAQHLFKQDQHYLVRNNKIEIIDPQTGRIMADRSWEHMLHQMIEAKEGCPITSRRETLARITYQQFFSRYYRLAGTSGTLREVASELQAVYALRVVTVPTHKPSRREMLPEQLYATKENKWTKFLARIIELHEAGRPVLMGTLSVAESEAISAMLTSHGLKHQVLNARQDQHEAEIIAQAGQIGALTVATNMAGRGTDIELGPGVIELGGLHVIATGLNEERRLDRQLFGRCARQGDPGSTEAILSLEDETFINIYSPAFCKFLGRFAKKTSALPTWLTKKLLNYPQRVNERKNRKIRQLLMLQGKRHRKLLAFSGKIE